MINEYKAMEVYSQGLGGSTLILFECCEYTLLE